MPINPTFARFRAYNYTNIKPMRGCRNEGVFDWGTVSASATITTLNHQSARVHRITVGGSFTIPNQSNTDEENRLTFVFTVNATGGYAITLPANFKVSAATAAALANTTASKLGVLDMELKSTVGWIEKAPLTWI